MNLKLLSQLFSLRDLRNAFVGAVVIFGGIGLSMLTLYAHHTGNIRLAGISAAISLLFVLLILIFVVPPLARNAGREASQMNLPFEFTTGGAVMLVLIMIVGFSAWNTGNNLLFIVLSFLIAAMLVGFFAGSVCLKKLDVRMRFPDAIFAGEPTPIIVGLSNRKSVFPAFSVVAEVRGKERERSVADDELRTILPRWVAERLGRPAIIRRTLSHFLHVERNKTLEAKADHIFPNRGRLLIKDFELSTKFPFGFFRHRRRLPACETELIVFPAHLTLTSEEDETPLNTGQFIAAKRGVGQDLLALRDYQPNDDFRHIDWKATARSRHLTVREYSAEDNKLVTVVLDTRVPHDENKLPTLREKIEAEQSGRGLVISPRFEAGVRLSAAMISQLAEENASVRLIVGGRAGDFGIGRRHLCECLKRLALADPTFDGDLISTRPELGPELLSDEREDSHWFLVTSNGLETQPPFATHTLKIIRF